jgi:hypothetical protein
VAEFVEYPKWVSTDPDDPSKGVTVLDAEEEAALLGPVQDVLDLTAEDEAPAPKPKK